jgi:hypothetical protein
MFYMIAHANPSSQGSSEYDALYQQERYSRRTVLAVILSAFSLSQIISYKLHSLFCKNQNDSSSKDASQNPLFTPASPTLSPEAVRIAELAREITLHPEDLSLREERCRLLSEQGEFQNAIEDADLLHMIQKTHQSAARAGRARVQCLDRYPDDLKTMLAYAQKAVELYTEALQLLVEGTSAKIRS